MKASITQFESLFSINNSELSVFNSVSLAEWESIRNKMNELSDLISSTLRAVELEYSEPLTKEESIREADIYKLNKLLDLYYKMYTELVVNQPHQWSSDK
jgi:hypothetical protein